MRFLIQGPAGEQYELDSVAYFLTEYAPQGFTVVEDPPLGYDVPDVKAAKKAAKAEAATSTTTSTTTAAPEKEG